MGEQDKLAYHKITTAFIGGNQVREYLQENKAYHLSFLIGAVIALVIAGVFADGAGYSLVPWVLGAFFVGEIVRFIAWRVEQKED